MAFHDGLHSQETAKREPQSLRHRMTFHDACILTFQETAKREPQYAFLDPGPIGSLYEAAVGWTTPSPELRGTTPDAAPGATSADGAAADDGAAAAEP